MNEKQKIPKRATVPQLIKLLERAEGTVRKYIKTVQVKPDKAHKYLVQPILEEMRACESRDARNIDPEDRAVAITWADKLKAKQIEKLDVQIQSLKGDLVGIDDVKAVLAEHASTVKGALNNFVQYVATQRNAELLKWAESARDSVIESISEEFGK